MTHLEAIITSERVKYEIEYSEPEVEFIKKRLSDALIDVAARRFSKNERLIAQKEVAEELEKLARLFRANTGEPDSELNKEVANVLASIESLCWTTALDNREIENALARRIRRGRSQMENLKQIVGGTFSKQNKG